MFQQDRNVRPDARQLAMWRRSDVTQRPHNPDPRDERVTVRLTQEERVELRLAARARDMSLGAYIRWVATDQAQFDLHDMRRSVRRLEELEREREERFAEQEEKRAAAAAEEKEPASVQETSREGSNAEAGQLADLPGSATLSALADPEFADKLCLALAAQMEFARFDDRGFGAHITESKNRLMRMLGHDAPDTVCPNEEKDRWDRIRFAGYWK